MRRRFYGQRDDADHAAQVLRDFGLLPVTAVCLLDDVTQWEVYVSELPTRRSDAAPVVAGRSEAPAWHPSVEPHEDDFGHSAWDWEAEDRRDRHRD